MKQSAAPLRSRSWSGSVYSTERSEKRRGENRKNTRRVEIKHMTLHTAGTGLLERNTLFPSELSSPVADKKCVERKSDLEGVGGRTDINARAEAVHSLGPYIHRNNNRMIKVDCRIYFSASIFFPWSRQWCTQPAVECLAGRPAGWSSGGGLHEN